MGWLEDIEIALGLENPNYQDYACTRLGDASQLTDDDLATFAQKTGVDQSTAVSWLAGFSCVHCCCCSCADPDGGMCLPDGSTG